jgi:hypothetical protein
MTAQRDKEFFMTASAYTIIYLVTDLAKAKTLFSTLLGAPSTPDEVGHVGRPHSVLIASPG